MDESSNSKIITPEEINSPKRAAVTQPKTYKNLSKRGSIYKIFAKNAGDNIKNTNDDLLNHFMSNLGNKSHFSHSRSKVSLTSNESKTSKLSQSKSSTQKLPFLINRNKTKYLDINNNISEKLDILLKDGMRKEVYYKNNFKEGNYGLKNKRINEAHLNLDKKDIAQNIAINGLNESFTNINSAANNNQKLKFVEVENSKFKLLKNAYENKNTALDPSRQYKNLNGEEQILQKRFGHYNDDPLN